jgi:flagellar biosynthesis/type III secretory pathway protein FliH
VASFDFDFAPLQPPAPPPDPLQAQALVFQAHAEAAAIREAARAEGLAAGHAEAMGSVTPSLSALDQAVVAAQARAESTAERLESEAVDLAFAVAEKILAARVESDPEVVLEAVRGALRGMIARERVTVLVHPDDLDLLRAASEELKATLGGIEHCEIQAERRVGRGGAIVHHADGFVDARIDTKLERAREAVLEQLTA